MKTRYWPALMLAMIMSPNAPRPAHAAIKPIVEVAFVLDTTGSMGPLIEGAKRKIWSIATAIADTNPDADIRIGLVAYRDIGDDYVTRTFQLTEDIQDLYGNLLELRAQGGGDWPESVNEALDVAVNKLHWSRGDNVRRIVFLVGDAPPHMDYNQDTKYPQTLQVAGQKDIVVNAVLAGGARDTERVWREVAQRGNGRFIPIPQDGGDLVVIETPYDEDIIILQKGINDTVIPYGPAPMQRRVTEKTKQVATAAAAAPSAASDMASYLNKRGRASLEAVTGSGDLIGDIAAGRQQLEAVPDSELPDQLRALPPALRQAELDKHLAQRKSLTVKLAELVTKRDRYIADQRSKTPKAGNSFDRAVEETLRAQIRP